MIIKIALFVLAFLPFRCYAHNLYPEWSQNRKLDNSVWTSNLDWRTCNGLSSCAFLNGICTLNTIDSISTLPYDQVSNSVYCLNSTTVGYIDLSNMDGNKIQLASSSDAWSTNHQLWEWRLNTTNKGLLYLSIARSAYMYEDIYIAVSTKSGNQIITSK